mmetsp:Transcript_12957/g.31205  ORF Transcript_12957/g.31205 Transcript_12957/m.31205 type:complete len:209 (+) Transcript_12957:211-837(+)
MAWSNHPACHMAPTTTIITTHRMTTKLRVDLPSRAERRWWETVVPTGGQQCPLPLENLNTALAVSHERNVHVWSQSKLGRAMQHPVSSWPPENPRGQSHPAGATTALVSPVPLSTSVTFWLFTLWIMCSVACTLSRHLPCSSLMWSCKQGSKPLSIPSHHLSISAPHTKGTACFTRSLHCSEISAACCPRQCRGDAWGFRPPGTKPFF